MNVEPAAPLVPPDPPPPPPTPPPGAPHTHPHPPSAPCHPLEPTAPSHGAPRTLPHPAGARTSAPPQELLDNIFLDSPKGSLACIVMGLWLVFGVKLSGARFTAF